VRAACARHLDDLEHASKRGWFWDRERANFVLDFFPSVLRLNGGQFEGKPFYLGEWQAFIVGSVFGWVDVNGVRRFQSAYLEVGKGNGKSPLAAGIGLYMLGPDGEARAEVYAAASKKDQAMILFRDAVAMVDLSPQIGSKLVKSGGSNAWNLAYPMRGSFFRAIASEDGQSGPRPHCALLDEVHEHPNDTMVEMMRAGFKFRRQPLIVMLTNSGFDKTSICWIQHEYAARVVTRLQEDDRYFSYVCGLDEGDDPFTDEGCWLKANPNLGVSITNDYLRGQVNEARGMPSKQSKVKRLNFCVWVDAANPWIERERWESCEVHFAPEIELAGEECVGGLDLSGTRDLTALALYFPERKKAFVEFWSPEETLREREEFDRVPYSTWVQQGFLKTTPGRNVDYRKVAQRIAELQMVFGLRSIAFDPYRIKYMETALEEEGVTVTLTPHSQGFYRSKESNLWMPRSIELLEKDIGARTIQILKNPVLSWNSASAVLDQDNKDNRIFAKRKSVGRIDGLVALAMARGAAEVSVEREPEFQVMFV
jgi:phage terminase large subunit-like protein